jgi:hypothetical protein
VSSGFVNLEADSGSATWFFSADAAKPAATAIRLTGAGAESPEYCTPWKEVKNLGAQPSIVGQAHIASNYKHVTDSFTYTTGQSSFVTRRPVPAAFAGGPFPFATLKELTHTLSVTEQHAL